MLIALYFQYDETVKGIGAAIFPPRLEATAQREILYHSKQIWLAFSVQVYRGGRTLCKSDWFSSSHYF